jgi:hypothetical protein
MTEHRPSMKLSAHPNVIDIGEERRQRHAADLTDEVARVHALGGMVFIGFQSAPADATPAPPRKRRGWLGWFRRTK